MNNNDIPERIKTLGEIYVRLWSALSELVTRVEAATKLKLFKARTLANFDCQGRGPAGRRRVGGKICYPRDELIVWFAGLGTLVEKNTGSGRLAARRGAQYQGGLLKS